MTGKIDGEGRGTAPDEGHARWIRLRVEGQVQGVGFRPFVHRLARSLGLTGAVRNDAAGVMIEAWGSEHRLRALHARVERDAPVLARVDRVVSLVVGDAADLEVPSDFRIVDSGTTPERRGRVTVDSAVCEDCLGELRDPDDRRYAHPLINCTSCGPRYTIVRDLPYDRERTTLAAFPMCERCAEEYGDPGDRRFHAQPVCCHDCGPRMLLTTATSSTRAETAAEAEEMVARVADLLDRGGVVAMKGLGGYHLVADATDREAVLRLRDVKRRDHKPFALMVPDLEAARSLCELSEEGAELLSSPASPVVIALWRREARRSGRGRSSRAGGLDAGPPPVIENAPGQERLGLMLPNTPMQHLLMDRLSRPLVMTSANLSDEPLVSDDDDAQRRFGRGVEAVLWHDRLIEHAVDDSVVLDGGAGLAPVPIRRARGFVPTPLILPVPASAPGLCMGADLKNAVAVVRGAEVVLSQHVGDLGYTLAYERCLRTVGDLQRLFEVRPAWVAVDLHPAYASHRYGRTSAERGVGGGPLRLVEVQHHHAHLASLLAEHGTRGPAIGIVCDGVGYGRDGTAWGGEILVGGLVEVERAAHLRPLRLPGGDRAAIDIGRCALSWLVDALGPDATTHPLARVALPEPRHRHAIATLLATDLRCPPSTGAGRLFDAAASLLGLCDRNHYEGMAGQLLEGAAIRSTSRPSGTGRLLLIEGAPGELDHRPLLRELADRRVRGDPVEDLAWLFHDAVAEGLARAALAIAEGRGLDTVGLSGGVFCNLLLTRGVRARLTSAGLRVLTHREVPPNDGGIALGQAAVAAAGL